MTKPYGYAILFDPTGKRRGAGQISDPRVFFCPAQQHPEFSFLGNNKGNNWLTSAGASAGTGGNPHMGYMYQIIHHRPAAQNNKPPHRQVQGYPLTWIMSMDMIYNNSAVAHVIGGSYQFNAAFVDGHVDTRSTDFVKQKFVASPNKSFTDSGWPEFDPLIQSLESAN
jgi:prepilin-type processing-associated H-X9-DG protein